VSTAVDDFRTRGTLISLRENTAVVFKGMQGAGTLVDRIPLDCAQVPNGRAVKDACNECQGTCGFCPGEPMCSERVWRGESSSPHPHHIFTSSAPNPHLVLIPHLILTLPSPNLATGEIAGCDRCTCCPDPDAVVTLAVPTSGRRVLEAPVDNDNLGQSLAAERAKPAPAATVRLPAAEKLPVHPAWRRRTQAPMACGMPALADLTPGVIQRMCPKGATSCADGSEFSFLVRRGSGGNERKVMLDFMGGGACWNEECLSSESTRFQNVWCGLCGSLLRLCCVSLTSTEYGSHLGTL
jgi:hypothetical protein